MWTYSQSLGAIAHNGQHMGYGYSGFGEGKNNPAFEKVPNVGPIPKGMWIIGKAQDDPHLGALAMPLRPSDRTLTFGRSGFWIHGDGRTHPGFASHGCIVLPYSLREEIATLADVELEVVE